MKYIFLFLLVLITGSLLVKYVFTGKPSPGFMNAVARQENPFRAQPDSAGIIWQRAKLYLDTHASLIAGAERVENDSLLFIPYYNSHRKGSSIQIEKHIYAGTVSFGVQCWYSEKIQVNEARKIALFMQQGVTEESFGR